MFYVIGTYSDKSNSILGEYKTLEKAKDAIWWQGQPRGEIEWLSEHQTAAETWYSGGRYPTTKTRWTICAPSKSVGIFLPLHIQEPIKTGRGCFTHEAYTEVTERAVSLVK